ncbi:MAG: hypothetical protein JNM24_20055 [Bdellovibrionaceae bacterium]|nr:hypothetical protein [Pseudobdellovibrionaceae bacterium]
MGENGHVWIRNKTFDSALIIGPHFYAVFAAIAMYPWIKDIHIMPIWVWFILVLCVDVAHVYSTLFRVYLDKNESRHFSTHVWLIPLVVWFLGVLLYSLSSVLFWRCLAYLAVFHFIRQQYGFFRIYSGKHNGMSLFTKIFNQYAIYYVTVIPVLIWHFSGPKEFNWFVDRDFIYYQSETLVRLLTHVLAILVVGYVVTEARLACQQATFNWAKNGIYLGTLLIWYLGIVYFNNDIIFTITNVIAHGVPYLGLIWVYKRRNQQNYQISFFRRNSFLIFIGSLILLAYVEEFLWASLVWKEHLSIFFLNRGQVFDTSPLLLSYIVPLLAVPQGTHYILDAFIWKIRDSKHNQWTSLLGDSRGYERA